jgi:hypothetical protein
VRNFTEVTGLVWRTSCSSFSSGGGGGVSSSSVVVRAGSARDGVARWWVGASGREKKGVQGRWGPFYRCSTVGGKVDRLPIMSLSMDFGFQTTIKTCIS